MSHLQEFKLILKALETLRWRITDWERQERSFNAPSLRHCNQGNIERAHLEIMRLHQCLETSVKTYIETNLKRANVA